MKACIQLSHVTKSFNERMVVKDLSLNLPRGKIIGFLGPNGSGKTTSIKIMCGQIKADQGAGTCLDFDINSEREKIVPHIGYMSQYFSLWENLTVQETLIFIARIRKLDDPEKKTEALMNKLGLGLYRDHLTGCLSGGWKQRVSLAAAIIHDPKILLLDEPTASVDSTTRKAFWELLNKLSNEGMTILVVTHFVDEAKWCHYLVYMKMGVLVVADYYEQFEKSQNLVSYSIVGDGILELEKKLSNNPGLKHTQISSEKLYITGDNNDKFNSELSIIGSDFTIEKIPTSLEIILEQLSMKQVSINGE